MFLNLAFNVSRGKTMLTVEQLETAILQLSPNDFNQLLEWFFDLDYQRWDEQLENDIAAGKLDNLAEEAIADFKAGHYRAI
jgi:hypothetical protein